MSSNEKNKKILSLIIIQNKYHIISPNILVNVENNFSRL
jgi:hypothetical protein